MAIHMANYKYQNSRARKRAIAKSDSKYKKSHTTGFAFRFNNEYDKDIIEKLQSTDNKSGYIKALIRADIEK